MKAFVALLALGALAALAACGSNETSKQQGAAFEKVLPGSASDAMLPYDTASSAPPLAPETYDAAEVPTPGAMRASPAVRDDEVAPQVEAT